MRNWFKYTLEDKKDKKYSTVLDFTSHQIKKDYSDLDKFFEFTNFNKDFSQYIFNYLNKKLYGKNLSVGSGWGHLEYHLSKKFDVTASDINDEYPKYNKKIKYIIIDIISEKFKIDDKFDNVFAPGIIYLFDEKELNIFFNNIKKTLNNNGNFYLFFRSSDGLFINFLDNYLLPLERLLKFFLMKFKKQDLKIQKNHHGFRRYKHELEMIIRKNELEIISKENGLFQSEYNRSKILKITGINKLLSLFKLHPYITIYHLKKLR